MMRLKKPLSEGKRLSLISLLILLVGLAASLFSDLSIYASEPWSQISLMLKGFLQPSIFQAETSTSQIFKDIGYTLSFALLGVVCSVISGFFLSLLYNITIVRIICTLFRAIHEIFWALIFIQIFGLSSSTAILAIAIPYSCTFARVFADIYLQAEIKPTQLFPNTKSRVSIFIYLLLPQVWPSMRDYIRYRFECGLRTSAVLGFVGLPTIGFHLETAFKQAQYSYAAGLLLTFFVLIATIKYWLKDYLIPVFIILSWWSLPANDFINSSENIFRFFSQDIWPKISQLEHLSWWDSIVKYLYWTKQLFETQAVLGIINTLLLTTMAVALTGVFCFMLMPVSVISKNQRFSRAMLSLNLLLMRSTPEYILAFVLLLLFGPSMLPAVIALAVHNSGLIVFLMTRRAHNCAAQKKLSKISLSHYFYKIQPRLYSGFLALLMYRAEIILRESAILGVLGITTLGFYIDSAFEDLRFDRAFFLLIITAILNVFLDQLAGRMQASIANQRVLVTSQ